MGKWIAEVRDLISQGQAKEMLFLARVDSESAVAEIVFQTTETVRLPFSGNMDFPIGFSESPSPLFGNMSWTGDSEINDFLQAMVDLAYDRGLSPTQEVDYFGRLREKRAKDAKGVVSDATEIYGVDPSVSEDITRFPEYESQRHAEAAIKIEHSIANVANLCLEKISPTARSPEQSLLKFCKDCRYGGPRVLSGLSEDALCEHPSGTDQRVSLVTGEVINQMQLTCKENRMGRWSEAIQKVCGGNRIDGGQGCGETAQFFEPLS